VGVGGYALGKVRRVRAGGSAGVHATSRERGGAGAGVPRAMVPMSAGTRVRVSGGRTWEKARQLPSRVEECRAGGREGL
jgi:hypothetical protein